jgi:hypothetical protein
VLRAAGETETTKKISKIGFICMKETLDFSFWQGKKFLQ